MFAVIIGTGCGAGVAIDGAALTGRHAIAGEFGQNPLPWPQPHEIPGPQCYCGKTGCIETWISGTGFTRDYVNNGGDEVDGPVIVERAQAGEQRAIDCIARYEDRLARSLAVVINIIDPDVIVLGGGMSNVQQLYATVPPLLNKYCFSDVIDTPIRQAKHGDSSGVRGAANLWTVSEAQAIMGR